LCRVLLFNPTIENEKQQINNVYYIIVQCNVVVFVLKFNLD